MVLSALLSRKNSSDIALALDATVEVNKSIDDYVKNIDTIYSYKSFKHELTLFDSKLSDEKNTYWRIQNHINSIYAVQQILLIMVIGFIFYLGISITSFSPSRQQNLEFILILVYSILNLSSFGNDFLGGIELNNRLNVALEKINFEIPPKSAADRQTFYKKCYEKRDLVLKDISYHYHKSGREIQLINDFSCRFKSGVLNLLEGSNGSGKTTLLKLIACLLIPTGGEIFQPKGSAILYINQNSMLFNRSLLDNIIYPETDIASQQLEKIFALAKILNIDNLLSSSEALNNEVTGEMVKSFSGGEKQKILIIRALLSKCNIILFDEITSGLDTASVQEFYRLIQNEAANKMMICVTHREEEKSYFKNIVSLKSSSNWKVK
ncbi:ATP-binding cassette domain-containing protein [Streptococcus tangpeifui]|uniref:ATP-binding cassette domain-containing protein n=1 Tax=Streptococcus tangpeifui TaxID=2709400 RepID=UPI001F14D060|nr:ATP-binding cassette domain-containing protein [Streptococcus sp. ZJ1593]